MVLSALVQWQWLKVVILIVFVVYFTDALPTNMMERQKRRIEYVRPNYNYSSYNWTVVPLGELLFGSTGYVVGK